MATIKKIFQGKVSKKALTHYYFPIMYGLFVICLFLAWVFYPYDEGYPYDWTTSTISRLGWPIENPIGVIFFSIGMLLLGVMLIPVVFYNFRRLSIIRKKAAKAVFILMLSHAIALIGIGAILNYPEPFFLISHAINAIIIFFSVYIAGIIMLLIVLRDNRSKTEKYYVFSKRLLIVYIIILIYGILTLLLTIINLQVTGGHYVHDSSTPLLNSAPFYEWQTFFAFFGVIYIQVMILPAEVHKREND